MKWISRFLISTLLTGMIWSQFAVSSEVADPRPSPSTPSRLAPTTKQVVYFELSKECVESIVTTRDFVLFVEADEKGNPVWSSLHYEGHVEVNLAKPEKPGCIVSHKIKRVPLNVRSEEQ